MADNVDHAILRYLAGAPNGTVSEPLIGRHVHEPLATVQQRLRRLQDAEFVVRATPPPMARWSVTMRGRLQTVGHG